MDKIYIYANAQNLFTLLWHKEYEGLDPERNTFGDGTDFYATPVTFTFGLNIMRLLKYLSDLFAK
ncbi:MAG: hypothetical protein LBL58_18305 [Tannerellaceae bacterium]|nr:hypothetical protein [Tannerellaceae bacterium]